MSNMTPLHTRSKPRKTFHRLATPPRVARRLGVPPGVISRAWNRRLHTQFLHAHDQARRRRVVRRRPVMRKRTYKRRAYLAVATGVSE